MTTHRPAKERPQSRWRDVVRVAFAVIVLAVVSVSYVLDRQRVDCERQWFIETTLALGETSAATGRTNRDFAVFAAAAVVALERPGDQTANQIQDALNELRAGLDRVEQARLSAPIPFPPEC